MGVGNSFVRLGFVVTGAGEILTQGHGSSLQDAGLCGPCQGLPRFLCCGVVTLGIDLPHSVQSLEAGSCPQVRPGGSEA